MGPSGMRLAGIDARLERLGYAVRDIGNFPVSSPETRDPGPGNARFVPEILEACEHLRARVREALGLGELPVVLGGDHSIAIGTVAGVAGHFRERAERVGLIWIDAHADMNTPESSPSGNVHGMPLAVILGKGDASLVGLGGFSPKVDPKNVCLIGLRAVDARERQIVRDSGINPYTMRDIDERGMLDVVTEAIAKASDKTCGFHVSFDIDGMDPRDAPGVGTPVPGGIRFREAHLLMEHIADSGSMLSLEVTELNPFLDVRNESSELAVEMIASALGQSIL
jgi:arginase